MNRWAGNFFLAECSFLAPFFFLFARRWRAFQVHFVFTLTHCLEPGNTYHTIFLAGVFVNTVEDSCRFLPATSCH